MVTVISNFQTLSIENNEVLVPTRIPPELPVD
jgi:hypothetical protein